jgi:nucleolar protein 56
MQNPKLLLMLVQKGAQREFIAKRLKISSHSFGLDLRMGDIKFIKQFASTLLISGKMKKKELFVVETKYYVQELVAELTPNLAEVASYHICAELVERARGLRNLAFLPASRIQLLGAETALFRHKKTGANPPKYGVLFQHAMVKSASPQEKGKIARQLACKLAIAARKDYARI